MFGNYNFKNNCDNKCIEHSPGIEKPKKITRYIYDHNNYGTIIVPR